MIIKTGALPDLVIVDPHRMLPRFWATAWSLSTQGHALAENTRKTTLRHLDVFYSFCDERYGMNSFDSAVSERDAVKTQAQVEAFYLNLTSAANYSTTAVQRWDAVRGFVTHLASHRSASSEAWRSLRLTLSVMGRMRKPRKGRIRFIRSIPASTLVDLLEVGSPTSDRNPFQGERIRERNWLIVNMLLLVGLRRSELMLLTCDALKSDVDVQSQIPVYWLDVTTTEEPEIRSTAPSMKTEQAHRQVPISPNLANLYQQYIAEFRYDSPEHGFAFTAATGAPLSAEAVTKIFHALSRAISPKALRRFSDSAGGKAHISPHDLRHTCATASYAMYMAQDQNRELTLQRMRAFFGWSVKSTMPEHYARAAIQEDLMQAWGHLFDSKVRILRDYQHESR